MPIYYFCTCHPKTKQSKYTESVRELPPEDVCTKEGICLNCEHYAIAFKLTPEEKAALTPSHLAKMARGLRLQSTSADDRSADDNVEC